MIVEQHQLNSMFLCLAHYVVLRWSSIQRTSTRALVRGGQFFRCETMHCHPAAAGRENVARGTEFNRKLNRPRCQAFHPKDRAWAPKDSALPASLGWKLGTVPADYRKNRDLAHKISGPRD